MDFVSTLEVFIRTSYKSLSTMKLLGILIVVVCRTTAFQTSTHTRFLEASRHRLGMTANDAHEKFVVPTPDNQDSTFSSALVPESRTAESNRRLFFASGLLAAGTIVGGNAAKAASAVKASGLSWTQNPVNKRSGVTVFDAEKSGYNVAFVTYLTRFLLCFDPSVQRYWFSQKMPSAAKAKDIEELRVNQFAALSASVEVGLQGYTGTDGPKRLLDDLVKRYGSEESLVPTTTDENSRKRQRREVKEARRQIALLFGLLQKNQPTKELTKLLAAVDNGSVQSVELSASEFGLFERGKEPILVTFPPPQAGDGYETAEGKVVLSSTGSLVSVTVLDGGTGYSSKSPPILLVSAPRGGGTPAVVKAKLSSDGSIQSVEVVEQGSGYSDKETVSIEVTQIGSAQSSANRPAVLSPALGFAIQTVEITNQGTGYAVEKPIKVLLDKEQLLDRNSTISSASQPTQIGLAYPKAEKSSYSSFRKAGDNQNLIEMEETFDKKYDLKMREPISGTISGPDDGLPPLPLWSPKSSSSELLALLPSGVGLEYDSDKKRYALAVDSEYQKAYPNAFKRLRRRIDSEFGPRGRAPIERDMDLDLSTYLRFCASGAICASSVHLALTPLDVVKTKVQTAPDVYPSIVSSFQKILNEEGLSTFFSGWLPTILGNFASGGILYALTEYIRRSLSEAAGVDAVTYEAPIILAAAACSAAVGAALACPFEAVRIRTVAKPDFAKNSVETLRRMWSEEGPGSLFNAIPVFLVKNVP